MSEEQEKFKRRKRGPEPIPVASKRENRLNVFFSDAELADLLSRVKRKSQLSSYVRRQAIAGKTQLTVEVPAVNLQVYAELARAAANLNQIARSLNESSHVDISTLQEALHAFRLGLIKQGGQ